MTKKSREKGFTLIELAIVLVVIGIIIGAILKGQDLIENARHKKFANEIKLWDTLTWAFLDRKGRFPGDGDRDGVIGEDAGDNVKTDLQTLANSPTENSLTLGSFRFYLWLGNDGVTPKPKNILTITNGATTAGSVAFSSDELAYMESFDASIDGVSDGAAGRVRGSNSAPTVASGTWVGTLTGLAAPPADAWTSATTALVYYFDRKPE